MDSVTLWLNAAGTKAISRELTSELLLQLSKLEPGSKRYTKTLNRICEGNLLLLYKSTKSYSDRRQLQWGTELSVDLLQAGYFGLRVAVERYDFSRGCKLSTCAVPWIKQRLGRHLLKREQTIYVPENLAMEVFYRRNSKGKPSGSKNAPKSQRTFEAAEAAMGLHLSLDMKYGEKENTFLSDLIEAPDTSNRGDLLDKKLLKIQDVMAKAGLEPKIQDFLLAYASVGNIATAARRAGVNVARSSKIYHKAIDQCKAVV